MTEQELVLNKELLASAKKEKKAGRFNNLHLRTTN
jgi:hypothetical protein